MARYFSQSSLLSTTCYNTDLPVSSQTARQYVQQTPPNLRLRALEKHLYHAVRARSQVCDSTIRPNPRSRGPRHRALEPYTPCLHTRTFEPSNSNQHTSALATAHHERWPDACASRRIASPSVPLRSPFDAGVEPCCVSGFARLT